jgi:hypothetical protein
MLFLSFSPDDYEKKKARERKENKERRSLKSMKRDQTTE